jgi:sugar/nucleoside kinase (ribokinase family)
VRLDRYQPLTARSAPPRARAPAAGVPRQGRRRAGEATTAAACSTRRSCARRWRSRASAGPGHGRLALRSAALPRHDGGDPNEPEVEEALGVTIGHDRRKLESAGRELLQRLACQAVLVTRGSDGMALFERGRPPLHIPVHGSDQVADVTGAGDTVIATFTLALASGASPEEAARLANYAGGIVVMKHATATVSADELLAAVRGSGPS